MQAAKCWCGNAALEPFSADYLRCSQCETLVYRAPDAPPQAETKGKTKGKAKSKAKPGNEAGLYGREYWFSHQVENRGYPDIVARTRTDLPERCLAWLSSTLKYKLPPGKSLELGGAHGGFVALLSWAGFDASGLDLSPWMVEFARKTFGVPMLLGPLEEQSLAPGSLDLIAMMDVIEHFPDPEATVRRSLELLKPDGVLVLQTPCYPEGESHEKMLAGPSRFLDQLLPGEHLQLFSRSSVKQFLGRLGLVHVAFEPAIFAHYDMFLVASRQPLTVHDESALAAALTASPPGRLVLSLLDNAARYRELQERNEAAEQDRAARLKIIHELEEIIHAQGVELAQRQAELNALTQALDEEVNAPIREQVKRVSQRGWVYARGLAQARLGGR